jgi:hypothetical protein
MTLSSLVMAVIAGICVAQMRLARAAAEQAATAEAVRTVTSVLAGEARRMMAVDVSAWSADSVALRAFRGSGTPCGVTSGGVLVRYTGDRLPDPLKDSILVAGTEPEHAAMLLESLPAAGMCMARPGEAVLELRMAGIVPQNTVLLVFESGSYHLTTNALRYRIGAAGRQPVTAEVLIHPFSGFAGVTGEGIHFRLQAGGRQSVHAAVFASGPILP